ncbi:MAG TPA: hypothetical protein P5158_09075 [Chitinophagaceae bacterium]|nr:hypothetical protein [Chitinophagaceae bacterium]
MGYYSEVAIAVDSQNVEKVRELIETECPDEFRTADQWNLFRWERVKWNNCDSIKAIETELKKLNPESYLFIRIGDWEDDIETRGKGNAPMRIESVI